MQINKKRFSVFIIAVLVYSLVATYALVPLVNAASLNDAKATITDSDIGVTATTTVSFITGIALTENYYIEVAMPTGFTNIVEANSLCPANSTTTVEGAGPYTVKCQVHLGQTLAPGSYSVVVGGHTNPTENLAGYTINVYTKSDTGVEQEKAQVKVYIIDDVTVTASVDASLTFAITGLDALDTVNGVTVTATSTATTTPFGTLSTVASSTVGQKLTVSTNATDGYTVTVFQNQELTSAGGANINSFKDSPTGTGSTTTALPWSAPAGILDATNTYGHMGVTTDDGDLSGVEFGENLYKGLNGTTPMEVMYYNHPVNGTGTGLGTTKVAYTAQISALQEAGDYTNFVTYVCTPQF
jgi:hypothetical protein